jgi:hypothetical protein
VLAAGSCVQSQPGSATDLGVDAIQEFASNPLGSGAPLAGVILASGKLSKRVATDIYTLKAQNAEAAAINAGGNLALRDKYEAEGRLFSAAADCVRSGDCTELNNLQKAMRTKAQLAEANASGGGHSH